MVSTPLKNMSSSLGMIIPNIWKVIQNSMVPVTTNQIWYWSICQTLAILGTWHWWFGKCLRNSGPFDHEKNGERSATVQSPARLWIASWSPRFLAEKYTSPVASPVAQYCSIEELCYYSTGLFEDIVYYSILSTMVQFEDLSNPRTMKNSIWPKLRRAMKTFHQFIRTGSQK